MNHSRTIGRVLSVDNFRVFIKIDEEITGAFRSGISDVYEVARINSYLIIPVGADRIVALITRVTMKEEVELNSTKASITLPHSARYVSATMLGTITQKNKKDRFVQGVYSFPSLDNPVWYVTKKDLDQIFDNKDESSSIDYQKDFYLPIGTSPAFQDYKIKICPDQFFVKHAAILGNTGSGKSCTLTSILRNLFRFRYNNDYLKNAHIVIFDTNGEYKNAFICNGENNAELNRINAYYYGGEGRVKIPYWLMNWGDFKFLLKPSEGVQAPVLNRAIGLAKNEQEVSTQGIPRFLDKEIHALLECSSEELKKRTGEQSYGKWSWKEDNEIVGIGRALSPFSQKISSLICDLANQDKFNDASKQYPIINKMEKEYREILAKNLSKQITNEQNIDLPVWFSYQALCEKFLDCSINQEGTSSGKVAEFLSTLRLRMSSFLNDKRVAIPLMLNDDGRVNKEILPQFIALILGDYNKLFEGKDQGNFVKGYNDICGRKGATTNQITIVDVSQLPVDVLETVTGILGRIILEFVANFIPDKRGTYPIVIVLEEAQNYIAEDKESIAKTVFERIAREGRKYGISLIVSSQRPSELSKTVLSQCNSFVIHRLQNPDDQKYVRGLISSANADLLEQLPIIPQQHAIITGDCVRTPIQVRIDDVDPTPNSHNPKFIENWLKEGEVSKKLYVETCEKWIGRKTSV